MATVIDPEERELEALKGVLDWHGTRVLEVGCGSGRLTVRLARLGARVVAFDSDPSLISEARQNLPDQWSGVVDYYVGSAEQLGYAGESFDVVVFAYSL